MSFALDCLTFDDLLKEEAMRFDRVKLYETLKPLTEQGEDISMVFFTVADENQYFYYIDETGTRSGKVFPTAVSMRELLDAANGDIERYGIIDRFSLQKYLCYLALHWL